MRSNVRLQGLYAVMLIAAALAALAVAETSAEIADTPEAVQDAGKDAAGPIFGSFRPQNQRFDDFDATKIEYIIRALVPYSLTYYFVDNGVQRGVSYVDLVVSEKIGRETMTYVSNIYKYYVAYQIALERNIKKGTINQAQGLK